MQNPRIFIAYAPRGVGLRCAVAYLPAGRDVYGWFTGPRDGAVASAYFALGDFHTPLEARYEAVDDPDLHSGWRDDAQCHELARMQDAFKAEWLFSRGDRDASAQLKAYADAELAVGDVNIRFERLSRLFKQQPNWTYYSPEFERGVLKQLTRY